MSLSIHYLFRTDDGVILQTFLKYCVVSLGHGKLMFENFIHSLLTCHFYLK